MQRLKNNADLLIGDVTTINMTEVHGGVQSNVVPPEIVVCFDIRIAIDVDHVELEAMFNKWCKEAGEGITVEYEQKSPYVPPTTLDDKNVFWMAFKSVTDELKLKIRPQIFPGGTDSRYIRSVGIPAIGFSPMNNTPVLLHDHDEFLKASTYLEGVEIYKKLIPKVANA